MTRQSPLPAGWLWPDPSRPAYACARPCWWWQPWSGSAECVGTWSEWHLDTWEKQNTKQGWSNNLRVLYGYWRERKKKKKKENKPSNGKKSISVHWWKGKENPSPDTDHWPQAWPVAEILPTRGLFFSYRSTSCRLSAKQSVEKHCYYNPIQFLLRGLRTDRILLS